MKRIFRDAEHLVRLAVLAALLLVIFLLIRHSVVPRDFGRYGHFRAGALDDIRARPVSFAGRETCEACHDNIAQLKQQARHARLGCEACHGGLAAHAADPDAAKGVKPDGAALCIRCHEADAAKPKWFPQVVTDEHAGGMPCTGCHNPHRPKV